VDQPRDGLAAVRAVIESGGEAITISDEEILGAIGELASTTGVFAEPAAAAPWAAAKRLAIEGRIGRDETVVLLVTGSGLKDIPAVPVGKPTLVDR
jgi:threonine synthase